MKKNIGMVFILSLLTFIMLNFLFWIIGYSMEGELELQFIRIGQYPGWIVVKLFYPIARLPWTLLYLACQTNNFGYMIMYNGYFFSLIIASIIAGLKARNYLDVIGGWTITGVISLIFIIVVVYDEFVRNIGYDLSGSLEDVVFELIISGILNILIFGCVALLITLIVQKLKSYKR